MTPKDKAIELFNKFYQYDIIVIGTESNFEERGIGKYDAKKLALICVDEIVNSIVITDLTTAQNQFNYWEKVKKEINLL